MARRELARPMYQHGSNLLQRVLNFLNHLLDRAFNPPSTPGGWWSLAVLGLLVILLVAGILLWTGPVARSRRAAPATEVDPGTRSARDHLLDAQRLAQAGDYGGAILECVRAIAAELQQRGALPPRPGRTADEFAAEAGQVMPAEAAALRAAATAFDDVCYGERPGTAAAYRQVAGLAGRIGISGGRGGGRGASAQGGAGPVPAGSRTS